MRHNLAGFARINIRAMFIKIKRKIGRVSEIHSNRIIE